MRRSRPAGMAVAVAAAAMAVAVVIRTAGDRSMAASLVVAGLAFSLVGGLIISKNGHRIGWLSGGAGLLLLLNDLLNDYSLGSATEIVQYAAWTSALFMVGLLVFLFPTGKALSRGWSWVAWAAFASQAISLVWMLFNGVDSDGSGPQGGLFLIAVAFLPISVITLMIRYVRSSGTVRQQIKWFTFSVLTLTIIDVSWEQVAELVGLPQVFWDLLLALGLLAVPLSIGIAILRYRLYDIDRIVSRTVSYLVVVVVLGVVFAALVWLPWIIIGGDASYPPLLVAASTLAVAALFNPVRKRVRERVDRRFNRAHYDAQRVSDDFMETLRGQIDPKAVERGWVDAVVYTMAPASIGLWMREDSTQPPPIATT